MKFSTKLSAVMVLLLAVSLSFGGYFLVHQNFKNSLENTVSMHTGQHLLERYALENKVLTMVDANQRVTNETLLRYGLTLLDYFGENRKMLAFYSADGAEIFNSFSADVPPEERVATLETGTDTYRLLQFDNHVYMLLASRIEGPVPLYMLSGYDITPIFTQRDQQLRTLLQIEILVMAAALVVISILSHMLTRPIRRLNIVSRKIAKGAYNVRTHVPTRDEIGELSRNFDIMADAVEQQVEELNLSVQQRDDFISAFTHEIKTPMTSIIGYSDLMRSMETDPASRQRAANHIYHEAKRLETLSQKLLMLMGLSEEKIELEAVPVSDIFAMVNRSLQPVPEGLAVQFAACGSLAVVADKDLLVDLLRNLILNALKAEPKDGKVRIMLRRQNQKCRFMVYDTGCGIAENEIDRLTEPFYMVDKSRAREQGGSGIGLALCKTIAGLHGTRLIFKSQLGVGTSVSFVLREATGGSA